MVLTALRTGQRRAPCFLDSTEPFQRIGHVGQSIRAIVVTGLANEVLEGLDAHLEQLDVTHAPDAFFAFSWVLPQPS